MLHLVGVYALDCSGWNDSSFAYDIASKQAKSMPDQFLTQQAWAEALLAVSISKLLNVVI
jgi:hypothetical protein